MTVRTEVIKRGNDEYIILNGRILTNWIGSEGAGFYIAENIKRLMVEEQAMTDSEIESHFATQLWPLQAGVFSPDDLVDLYRAIQR